MRAGDNTGRGKSVWNKSYVKDLFYSKIDVFELSFRNGKVYKLLWEQIEIKWVGTQHLM